MILNHENNNQRSRRYLFLSLEEWYYTMIVALCFTIFFWAGFHHISSWIGVGVFMATTSAMHLVYASKYMIPLPQLAALIGSLYYIFGPLIAQLYPHLRDPLFNLQLDPSYYFGYGIPASIALSLGWFCGMIRLLLSNSLKEKFS